jgi:hypothetical protein
MLYRLILIAIIWAPVTAWASDTYGTVTILEGEAFIYRGAARLSAVEGVRLESGDLLETAAAGFMQIERPDLSVVQFGPVTRAMVSGPTGHQKPDYNLFVLTGWCKLIGPKSDAAPDAVVDLRTPQFDLPPNTGTVVFQQSPADVTLFVERGSVKLAERQASGGSLAVPLKSGDYYARKAGLRGAVNPGSTQAFLGSMPRGFRDSLPLRIDRFRTQDVRPKDAPDFVYADVEPWLKAEPTLRKPLVQRWRVKARNPAFRAALIANLRAHPEWDPILFPEKYVKKDVVRHTARASAPPRDGALAPEPAAPVAKAASAPAPSAAASTH